MQAPKSIRLRLIEAAGSNNVHDLENLQRLDMATSADYQLSFKHAVERRAMDAVFYLWKCAVNVPEEDEREEHETSLGSMAFYRTHRAPENVAGFRETEHDLVRLVLLAEDCTWMVQIVKQAPDCFLRVIENTCLEDAHDNLLYLAHRNRAEHIFTGKTDHSRLLGLAILAVLGTKQHPWQGMHARVRDLCAEDLAATVKATHILHACSAVERCPDGTEERAMLYMLADGWRSNDKNTLPDIIINCFRSTKTGLSVHLLLSHLGIDDAKGTHACCAGLHGSCVAIEACLDRIHLIDATLANRLLDFMAKNRHTATGSRSLAHILERLLRHASIESVERSQNEICAPKYSEHAMQLFLIEHVALHRGW
jgi:hypothetical protein